MMFLPSPRRWNKTKKEESRAGRSASVMQNYDKLEVSRECAIGINRHPPEGR